MARKAASETRKARRYRSRRPCPGDHGGCRPGIAAGTRRLEICALWSLRDGLDWFNYVKGWGANMNCSRARGFLLVLASLILASPNIASAQIVALGHSAVRGHVAENQGHRRDGALYFGAEAAGHGAAGSRSLERRRV